MRQENVRNCYHPTVYNRLKRYELDCSICPPNRNENKKNHKKYGVRKPRTKIRSSRTARELKRAWVPIEEW